MRETPVQDEVMRIIGVVAFDRLVAELGGHRLVVPVKVGPHHPLAQAIGLDLARRLSAEKPALTIDLPLGQKKRALIAEALADNVSAYQIAKRYFCSVRFVYKIQAELRAAEPPKQMGLFN